MTTSEVFLHNLNSSLDIDDEIKHLRPWAIAIAIYGMNNRQLDLIDRLHTMWNALNESSADTLIQKLENVKEACRHFNCDHTQLHLAVFFHTSTSG